MKIRPVDDNDDMIPVYDIDQLDDGADAVVQIIKDNILLPSGEWWGDENLGIDIPGFILDNARLNDVDMLQSFLTSYILGISGVDEVYNIDVEVVGKQMKYKAIVVSGDEEAELEVNLDGLLSAEY